MTINPDDIKLYESQRLTDETDGGGRATGNVVVDGQINNLFPDISRLDRTVGDVALRKAFAGVNTNNRDTYLGAHAILRHPPADSKVDVVLFKATSEHDTRTEASNFLESYSTKSVNADWWLLGDQLAGQRQLVGFQFDYQPVPQVGDVFYLRNTTTGDEQYVRVTKIDEAMATYTYSQNNQVTQLRRRRLDMQISAPLDHTFIGGQPNYSGTTNAKTSIKTTEVSDAAEFFGAATLGAAVSAGDVSCNVDDIYSAIVPSSQTEQALLNQGPSVLVPEYTATGSVSSFSSEYRLYSNGEVKQWFFERSIKPGSVLINFASPAVPTSAQDADAIDDGKGTIVVLSGGISFTGSVDYEQGVVTLTKSGSHQHSYLSGVADMAARTIGRALSQSQPITEATRGFVYTLSTGSSALKPGTARVDFMALGRWYTVLDNGDGTIGGGDAAGTGTIDYANGTVAITLSAMPDTGTDVIMSWAANIADQLESIATGASEIEKPAIELQLGESVEPGSLAITYTSGSTTYTATDAAIGVISGDGAGQVAYASGEVSFVPDRIPDAATTIDVAYRNSSTAANQELINVSLSNGVASFTLADAPIKPGSLSLSFSLLHPSGTGSRSVVLTDNGSGGFNGVSGTVNYTTGAVSVAVANLVTVNEAVHIFGSGGGGNNSHDAYEELASAIIARSQPDSIIYAPTTIQLAVNGLQFRVATATTNPLVQGSVGFSWAGSSYYDRDGLIYRDMDASTGAGTAVGEINYNTRTINLYDWPKGVLPSLSVTDGLTYGRRLLSSIYYFRTPGAPLRPQSLQIKATKPNGDQINVTSDANGAISAAGIDGEVDYKTGLVRLWFTSNPADQTGASDIPINLNDVSYNAVLIASLPLDANLIGLDPVRLPSDGRVPIFREGNVIVFSHTGSTNIGTPTPGQVVTLSRDHQSDIVVVDSNGLALDPAQYTANKIAGTVTFADPLTIQAADTSPLVPPLFVEDSIEHMTVCNDVQVTGQLGFIGPTFHDFPANETIVSSALTWGDVNARYYNLFDQKTWGSGNWSASVSGDSAAATYDDLNNPVEVYNNGAVTEKWAVVFTASTTFQVIGQTLGIIATGNTSADCAPINPNTGNPYFIVRSAGWGTGWVAGNALRFDTDGCLAPLWIARTVLSGQPEQDNDQFTVQIRGDAD